MSDYQPKILKRTQFGNPMLSMSTKRLTVTQIKSTKIQHLIEDMAHTLSSKKYGVGIAAPQVGESLAVSVIDIQPKTANHASDESFTQVIINPEYTGVGEKTAMWEGCLSLGTKNSLIFAQTQRYESIKSSFFDEQGKRHQKTLKGLPAHVFQHETDHLNGILFPERVEDHTSWMNGSEYRKRIVAKRKQTKK